MHGKKEFWDGSFIPENQFREEKYSKAVLEKWDSIPTGQPSLAAKAVKIFARLLIRLQKFTWRKEGNRWKRGRRSGGFFDVSHQNSELLNPLNRTAKRTPKGPIFGGGSIQGGGSQF